MRTESLDDLVRQLLALPPYNEPSNFCAHDAYFAQALRGKYGDKAVDAKIRELRAH